MRFLLLADIHANFTALRAVLDKATEVGFDKIMVLGDFIGYGCDVKEVVDYFRDNSLLMGAVLGNHDNAVLGKDTYDDFNEMAKWVVEWSRENLSEKEIDFLKKWKDYSFFPNLSLALAHGSLLDRNEYVNMIFQAKSSFKQMITKGIKYCFFGHTHLPMLFVFNGINVQKIQVTTNEFSYFLDKNNYYLINPGSVGQPRDRNPAASFAIFDLDVNKITYYRVNYNIKEFQERMLDLSFPEKLIKRLEWGR